MEQIKHTPGPWKIIESESASWGCVEVANKRLITVEGRTSDEALANVRLTAAAPELLEALRGLVNNSSRADWPADLIDAAERAISKAIGA